MCVLHDSAAAKLSVTARPLLQRTEGLLKLLLDRVMIQQSLTASAGANAKKNAISTHCFFFFLIDKCYLARVKHQSLLCLDLFYIIQCSSGSCKQ